MARGRRRRVSQDVGSVQIISRVVGGQWLLGDREKEYFLQLLKRLASGFFIRIHAFVILDNHFHILATQMDREAEVATKDELVERYKLIYGQDKEPPEGVRNGCIFIPDEDGGTERLRARLGSVSRFVQTLKQEFSCWYNRENKRTGYFWGERYKGIITYKGGAQLATSTYIDLNAVRAGIVERP
ncbi:MAG: hypothetical protein GY757_51200, partial [bacterium]|nr:hypothetical protein [bacterium]